MKGILILEFNENVEVNIKAQFPLDFSSSLNLKASDLMNIYTLHRMDKNEPNFFQMEIKEYTVGSFFTGFSLKNYVGYPNYAITVFFSNEEIKQVQSLIDFNFEGKLRKIAYDLLKEIEEKQLENLLKDYYKKLENDEIEPYWEEYNEDEISQSIPLPNESLNVEELNNNSSDNLLENPSNPHDKKETKEDNFYKLENESLKEEIKSLELILQEKNEKINQLENQENIVDDSSLEEWKSKYNKLEEYNKILVENVDKLTEMSTKYNEEINKKNKELNDLNNKIESQESVINELNNKIENINNELEEYKKINEEALENFEKIEILKKENEKIRKDNEMHLDSIAELKIKLRVLKEEISSKENFKDGLKEETIDLKKEIKVLRRERDHYKNIIKEHKLL